MILIGLIVVAAIVIIYYVSQREYATNTKSTQCPACPDCPGCPACPAQKSCPSVASGQAGSRFWGIYFADNLDGVRDGYLFIPDGPTQSVKNFKWYIFTINPNQSLAQSNDEFGVTFKDGSNYLLGSVHQGSLNGTALDMIWTTTGVKTTGGWNRKGRINIGIPGRPKNVVFTKVA